MTVGSMLDSWLISARSTLRPRTWERYEQYVRLHLKPQIGRVRLVKLTPEHLDQLYRGRIDSGLSPTTVVHLHRVIHVALEHALRRSLVVRNVAELVEPPHSSRPEMKTLSAEQANLLIAAASTDPLEALFVVAVTTGMRQGELLGLQWRDIDLDRASVRVDRSLQSLIGRGLVLTETKTPSSRRQVLLTAIAVSVLRRQRVRQSEQRLAAGAEWHGMDLVFANRNGGPIHPSNLLRQHFWPLLNRAGLPRIRFHDLRHTAATLLLGEGVHPKVVAEMLGHSRTAVTLDLYSHVTPTMQEQAVLALDRLLHA